MDYETIYKRSIELAKHFVECGHLSQSDAEEMFPELRESEDERIRKAIESIIRVYGKTQGEWIAGYDMDTLVVHLRNAFASLEKQKALRMTGSFVDGSYKFDVVDMPNPAECSEEDKEMLDFAIRAIGLCRQYAINNQVNGYSKLPDVPKRYEELQNWLKSKLRSKPHWKPSLTTADLENDLCDIQDNYHDCSHEYKVLGEVIEFIRSTESHWKPSEEQMSGIACAINTLRHQLNIGDKRLDSLYEDLKKL